MHDSTGSPAPAGQGTGHANANATLSHTPAPGLDSRSFGVAHGTEPAGVTTDSISQLTRSGEDHAHQSFIRNPVLLIEKSCVANIMNVPLKKWRLGSYVTRVQAEGGGGGGSVSAG